MATDTLRQRIHRIEMRELLGWQAHELAQPLAAMGSYVGAAMRLLDNTGDARASGALRASLDQIDRAREIIRSARGRFAAAAAASVPLAPCVTEVCSDLGMTGHPSAGVTGEVTTCRDELETLLHHLIRNALEASGEEGTAVTASRGARGDVALSVSSQAAARFDQRWFEAYHSNKAGHLGIGLTVVKRLSRALDAEVATQATPTGGICFTLTFPAPGDSAP